MNKQRATALGCTAGFVVLCGVAMSVVMYFMGKTALDGLRINAEDDSGVWKRIENPSAPSWLIGIIFVLPGVFGIVAAFSQYKCMYITNCIFSLISLIIMGLLFFFIGMALIILIIAMGAVEERCYDDKIEGACKCKSDNDYEDYKITDFRTCDFMSTMTGLCIGLFVTVVMGWVFLLAEFVLSCVYACRSQPSSSGAVFVPAQQPMLPPEQQYPPQYQK